MSQSLSTRSPVLEAIGVSATAEALARLAMSPPVSLALGAAAAAAPAPGALARGPRATGVHDFTAPATFYVNRF